MDLSKYFKSPENTTSKSSVITPFMYEIFYSESAYPTHLRNAVVAAIICEKYPKAKTTSKSVASIRSKQKSQITHYIALRAAGTSAADAYQQAKSNQ
jgi:hypothetical protein